MAAATRKHGLAGDSTPAKRARRTKAADTKRPAANAQRVSTPPPGASTAPSAPTTLNTPPTTVLDVFVFGDGEAGELGLGPAVTSASRPRLNPYLSAPTTTATTATTTQPRPFATVQVACGGMHSVALTRDNQIVTWGVNDLGALGRDTAWDGGFKTIRDGEGGSDSGSDDDSDDDDKEALNPRESTPTAIPAAAFPAGTRFVQVAAGDSCSFALTDDGAVYGWGAFRAPNGETFFSGDRAGEERLGCQRTPVRIPGLRGITQLAVGANHALALEGRPAAAAAATGPTPLSTHPRARPTRHPPHTRLWAWGCGDQGQLGCRLLTRRGGLRDPQGRPLVGTGVPRAVVLPRAAAAAATLRLVAAGEYHAFAVGADDSGGGRVWAWGLDSFGQTGAAPDALRRAARAGEGEEAAAAAAAAPLSVAAPTEVAALAGAGVVAIAGGGQHSVALCADGRCLAWGRVDGGQLGLDPAAVAPDRLLADARGRVRACLVPTEVRLADDDDDGTSRPAPAVAAACGTGHTILVAAAATSSSSTAAVFGTGFNTQMQLGLGADADEEVLVPTRLQAKALQGRCLVWAGAGGQFSMVAGPRRDAAP